MRNVVRGLKALIAVGAALILVAPTAQANILDAIVVAHRAGAATKYGEGTLASYKYSVAHDADVLDGDIHWTRTVLTTRTSLALSSSSTTPRSTGSPTAPARSLRGSGLQFVISAAPTTANSRSFVSRP
jgi:hypothetical protein